jgi:Glycosyl hydrolase family 26
MHIPERAIRPAVGLAASLALSCLILLLVACGAQRRGPTTSTAFVNSGVYAGSADPAGVQAFAALRGTPVSYAMDSFDMTSWSALMSSAEWAVPQWQATRLRMVWSVPMLTLDDATSMSVGAAGGYNQYFRALAELLVRDDEGGSIIRIGWEFNGTVYPWSAVGDPQTYIAYWRQIVRTMRSVAGQHFQFDWCVSDGATPGFDPASAYPGDDYVDYIGSDVYDEGYAPDWRNAKARWDELKENPSGLTWQAAFAAAHDKPLSYPEWGLKVGSHGGGDDPYFIQAMFDWFIVHPPAFEIYYNSNAPDSSHQLTGPLFPRSEKLYVKLWKSHYGQV